VHPEMTHYWTLYWQAELFFFLVLLTLSQIDRCRFFFGNWKPPLLERLLVFTAVAMLSAWGVTKAPLPPVGDRLGNWLLWTSRGLVGDDSGVVAESAQAAAVSAYEAETAGIIAGVSNGLAQAAVRLISLTNSLATDNVPVLYIVQDAPRDLPGRVANHNLAVTQERMAMTSTNVLSVWFRYSWEVSTAAAITVRCYVNSNDYCDLESTTNTFPVTQTVTHADGTTVACYRYDFDASPLNLAGAPMAVIPPYEATFGGSSGEPFEVPGLGVTVIAHVAGEGSTTTNAGFTGWVNVMPAPWGTNLHLRCAGGSVVEALWHGTNITGVVTL
jgi:hypothetical protein